MKQQKATQAGKARTASIAAEIDSATAVNRTPPGEVSAKTDENVKQTPREFVDQWMAEHEKKRRDK